MTREDRQIRSTLNEARDFVSQVRKHLEQGDTHRALQLVRKAQFSLESLHDMKPWERPAVD